MLWWVAAACGIGGAALGEFLDLYLEIRRRPGLPWRAVGESRRQSALPSGGTYLLASALRLAMGGGTAAIAATVEPDLTVALACGIGYVAPLLLERLAKLPRLVAPTHPGLPLGGPDAR